MVMVRASMPQQIKKAPSSKIKRKASKKPHVPKKLAKKVKK